MMERTAHAATLSGSPATLVAAGHQPNPPLLPVEAAPVVRVHRR